MSLVDYQHPKVRAEVTWGQGGNKSSRMVFEIEIWNKKPMIRLWITI